VLCACAKVRQNSPVEKSTIFLIKCFLKTMNPAATIGIATVRVGLFWISGGISKEGRSQKYQFCAFPQGFSLRRFKKI
jgi:hypothetical protein